MPNTTSVSVFSKQAQRRKEEDKMMGGKMMKKKGILRLYQNFCRKCAIFRDSRGEEDEEAEDENEKENEGLKRGQSLGQSLRPKFETKFTAKVWDLEVGFVVEGEF